MTRHGPTLLALSVLAIAGWTYNVNYDTRAALDRLSELRAQIAEEREALQVLNVEWAWLNAPDRLARLTVEHNDRLGLIALTPEALGQVAAVPYPRGVPEPLAPPASPGTLVAAAPGPVPAGPLPPEAEDGPAETEAPGLTIAAAPEEGGIDIGAIEPAGESAVRPVAGTLQGEAGPAIAAAARAAGLRAAAADADAGFAATADAVVPAATDPAATVSADPVIAAAAEKAGAIAQAPAAPATMQEAVTLALAEAGIVAPGAASGTAAPAAKLAVLPASAAPIPVPPARPAIWARR